MARRKAKSGKLSVFKGREAKLNRAIFHILALQGPQTIYDLTKRIKKQKFLGSKLYSVVNRRVKSLEQLEFVEKAGTRKTLAGSTANIYRLTAKAYLAILLDQTNPDSLIKEVSQDTCLTILGALIPLAKTNHDQN